MKSRCYREKTLHYEDYGGRGITVCDEWKNSYEVFRDWAYINSYKVGWHIDRIDNDGNYEPGNCRWATVKENQNNRRNSKRIIYNGEEISLIELSEKIGIKVKTLYARLARGETVEDITNAK